MKNLFGDLKDLTGEKDSICKEGTTDKSFEIGSIITVKVIAIYENFVEVGIDGRYIGSIHISKIRDAYVRDLQDYFYIGQSINVLVEDRNDVYGYQFKYESVRQPSGLKTNTIVQAKIACQDEDTKKYSCSFVDFEGANGVVGIVPQGYVLREGDIVPVKIIDIRKDLAICKL